MPIQFENHPKRELCTFLSPSFIICIGVLFSKGWFPEEKQIQPLSSDFLWNYGKENYFCISVNNFSLHFILKLKLLSKVFVPDDHNCDGVFQHDEVQEHH